MHSIAKRLAAIIIGSLACLLFVPLWVSLALRPLAPLVARDVAAAGLVADVVGWAVSGVCVSLLVWLISRKPYDALVSALVAWLALAFGTWLRIPFGMETGFSQFTLPRLLLGGIAILGCAAATARVIASPRGRNRPQAG